MNDAPDRPRPRPFSRFAKATSRATGHAVAFFVAFLLIVAWAVAGPWFGWSDTWQLTINTATTIVTFLMVFVIQNTQMRDIEAMQIKMDEMLRATRRPARLLGLEELPEKELHKIQEHYEALADRPVKPKRKPRAPSRPGK
jgi:low affinity Fe/Cu permease